MMRPHVLTVEDNPTMRKLIRRTLESAGYRVQEAADARTALRLVQEAPPELILQDLLLPDMDGFELARRLGEVTGELEIPIIAVSGYVSKLDEAQGLEAGFADVLFKPVEPSRLLALLAEYVPVPMEAPRLAGRTRRVLVVDDDPVQRKLLGTHLADAGLDVDLARDGTEALEKLRACRHHALVSDVLMPRMDGFELCAAVRRDPALSRTPVFLTSTAYIDEADRLLARRVGANAYLVRTPSMREIVNTVLAGLNGGRDPIESTATPVDAELAAGAARQLHRQLGLRHKLLRRASAQATQLAVLSGLSETLARTRDVRAVLGEVVHRCREACDVSQGAIYLRGADGDVELHDQVGYDDANGSLPGFFGHPELLHRALADGEPMAIVPDAGTIAHRDVLRLADAAFLLVIPLVFDETRFGILVLGDGARRMDADFVVLGRALGSQIAQALALGATLQDLQRSHLELARSYDRTLEGWARALELRDHETEGHARRVTELSERLGRALGMSESELLHLRRGAMLHDIGKMGVPDVILHKPGPLTDAEWEIMRRHTSYACEVLRDIEFLRPALDVPRCHHERWDGSGYPDGLEGEQIPFAARIFAVADVFDALCSERPYREAWPVEQARDYIRERAGTMFDPAVVEVFLGLEG